MLYKTEQTETTWVSMLFINIVKRFSIFCGINIRCFPEGSSKKIIECLINIYDIKPHSVSECTNVFTLMPQGEIFHSIEGAVLCTMYIAYLPIRVSWTGLCVFGTTFCSFGSDEVQKNVTCTGMMIIWSTLNEHSQHAKKDLSDGPGLMDSVSRLPNQWGRQSECFGPVSLLLWCGWGDIWGSIQCVFKSSWLLSFVCSSLFHAHNKVGLSLRVVNCNTCYA